MKIPERPKSNITRAGITILAVWIFVAILFVLFNRYRYGSDWDSITDLLLLAFFLPASLASLGIASWAAGRRVSLATLGLALAGVAVAAGWSAYQTYQQRQAAQSTEERRAKHFEQLEAKFGARCTSEKSTAKRGGIDPYKLCLLLEEDLAAGKIR